MASRRDFVEKVLGVVFTPEVGTVIDSEKTTSKKWLALDF